MRKNILFLIIFLGALAPKAFGQVADSTNFSIYYSSPQKLVIAGVEIAGIRYLDRDVLVQLSGLTVGEEIDVPGEEVTTAIRKLWEQGLFSDVRINATKILGNRVWLEIYLQERPRLSDVAYHGISKSERDDITGKVLLLKGSQVTDNQINNAQRLIKNIFLEKGFLNTEVNIVQRDDTAQVNSLLLDIYVDKKEKVRVQDIIIHGNEEVKYITLERAMKKTNTRKLRNFFRTKKYLDEKFQEDKLNLVKKYNTIGYRDAVVLRDTVYPADKENRVNVEIWLEEGNKYYFRDIKWIGNTVYPSEYLNAVLGIKRGDIFDQKLLDKRISSDDDAVSNVYLDNGYLFFQIDPVEVNITRDSIDLEMRMYEGKQATISSIGISGNTKTHEHVARREIRTYPGDLFSKTNIIRTIRELSQLGHFDPEAITPDVVPKPEEGTVDINYQLQEKANDQIELSGGWGAGMFVGSVGLKFANFSARNIFNKEAWRPLPTGDGQTLSLRYQTSGQYYKTVSLSFIEPWLGGKKPNSFSSSLSYSRINYSANKYMQNYGGYGGYGDYGGYGGYPSYGGYGGYPSYGGYSGYGGYGGYGGYPYGSYYPTYTYNYEAENTDATDDQIWETLAVALGYGYRLSWPDDYFTVYHELSFEHYRLQNMGSYFYFLADETGQVNGTFRNTSFKTSFGRNSVDNPLYSRSGSQFTVTAKITPPFSMFSNKDYSDPELPNSEKYNWIEYHKWLFKGQVYNSLSKNRNLVLRSAVEFGFLGYYNKNLPSPFEGFIVGGSGMSGYNIYGTDYVALRGYRDFSLSPRNGSKMYSKFTMEMRYPVTLKPSATIYALTFLEAGNTNDIFQNYNPYKLYRSAGVGVRIFLPMFGLMGIDWGYGFDQVPGQGDAGGSQFHFVIGQQF